MHRSLSGSFFFINLFSTPGLGIKSDLRELPGTAPCSLFTTSHAMNPSPDVVSATPLASALSFYSAPLNSIQTELTTCLTCHLLQTTSTTLHKNRFFSKNSNKKESTSYLSCMNTLLFTISNQSFFLYNAWKCKVEHLTDTLIHYDTNRQHSENA